MAGGDSSDFTFCKVSSAENGGQLGPPKASLVASIEKKNGSKTNDSDKDRRSGSSISINTSTQDHNMKDAVTQTSGGVESNVPSHGQPSSKKPVVRAKIPFEKGYSQMDWLKLTRTHPDLAAGRSYPDAIGLKGSEAVIGLKAQ